MTGAGFILPADGFLTQLREITARYGVLLVFDEIISFRVARGGAQELYGVQPDLTALAKVIAGGTPGGAFGGRAEIMAFYDPVRGAKIPQAGTFNGNPVTMVAGLVTLRLLTPDAYERLEALAGRAVSGLQAAFADAGIAAQVTHAGSLLRVHLLSHPPRNYRDSAMEDKELLQILFFWLLNHDILWAPLFNISLVMDDGDVAMLVDAVRRLLKALPG